MSSEDDDGALERLLEENARLRDKLNHADHERSLLRQDLDAALAAVDTAKQELQDFVYAASHDLKEPLRSISSYTQLLQRHGAEPLQMAEYSRFIMDGVASATKLLDQLLRLSRAGSNPRRTNVKLGIPLQSALYRLQPSIQELHAEVRCGPLPEFCIDEAQFAELLVHLLDNALKYHGAATPVIEISAAESDDGLLLTIQDNGVGIPPKFCEQVFAPFKRLHGREIPGAGLGLAISRKIVAAHEGKIWAESRAAGGSTVKLFLPY